MTEAVAKKELPKNLTALTSLRYFAAIWVVAFHYLEYMPTQHWIKSTFAADGLLAVDFFFILSGFILAHTYAKSVVSGVFRYYPFLVKRLARIYPAHIVMLVAFIALSSLLVFVGIGVESPERYRLSAILPNILLVHAWGFAPAFSFNYPSWSISAEWMAYLLFPVIMAAALALGRLKILGRPRNWLPVGVALVILLAVWAGAQVFLGKPVTAFTTTFVYLRILPEFFLGVCLYFFALTRGAAPKWMVAVLGLGMLALAQFSAPHVVLVMVGAALVLVAALAAWQPKAGVLDHPFLVYLGEISYGLYMIHIFVGPLMFHALKAAHLKVDPALTFFGAMVAVTLLAAVMHRLIEIPGRALILRLLIREPAQQLAPKPLV